MKIKISLLLLIAFMSAGSSLYAQSSEKDKATIKWIDSINRQTDDAMISKDTATLLKLYAKDCSFMHGGGNTESKDSWINNILNADRHYISRTHDSVQVELHRNVAITKGKLLIVRQDKEKIARYGIRYLRIYAMHKNNWQLISNITTSEWTF